MQKDSDPQSMEQNLIIDIEHHRTKARVKELGEVFTPEKFVKEMMALFDKKIWADESTVFFEPSCGHGNIVIPVLEKRLNTLHEKYKSQKGSHAKLRATAVAINTVWAIDLCPQNIELTRKRILQLLVIKDFLPHATYGKAKQKAFLAHLLCALETQIHENEALSSLSAADTAALNAQKTKIGYKWYRTNGHKNIDFEKSWTNQYSAGSGGTAISLYNKAEKFIDQLALGKSAKSKIFGYASEILQPTLYTRTTDKVREKAA